MGHHVHTSKLRKIEIIPYHLNKNLLKKLGLARFLSKFSCDLSAGSKVNVYEMLKTGFSLP